MMKELMDTGTRHMNQDIRREFGCNGTMINDEEAGEVMQLQGDHWKEVGDFDVGGELKLHGAWVLQV